MHGWTELAGVAAGALAAACFDGAVVLQAREARMVDAAHGLRLSLLTRLARRPGWLVGTAVGVAGWPLQLLAFSLAPVTVVQPTLAVGLVLLLAAGHRMLGEHVGRREWLAAGAVIAGVVVLAAGPPAHTHGRPSIAAAIACGAALGCVVALPFLRGRERAGAWTLIAAAGSAFALAALTSKMLTIELAAGRPLAALAWAAATAACSAVGFLVDMTALQGFEATRVAPPMFVVETALPVALAPVLFGERWSTAGGGTAAVLAGRALTLAGGAALGRSRTVLGVASAPGGDLDDDLGRGRPLPVGEVGPTR
jgi:drug/metabolite transporter (DMT)-like permease